MKKLGLLLILVLITYTLRSQELFIQEEPASTIPKGVIGIRVFTEVYHEPGNRVRGLSILRAMYGLTPKLTVMATASASNHHSKQLPPDFPDHNTPQIGVPLPWRFNGVNLSAKYRFFSSDGAKTHFRIAAYASASWLNVAHDEAEPDLMDDTKGVGGGFITTWLKNHFAVSFTGGYILPATYKGNVPDEIAALPPVPAKIKYGKAFNYSLSFGYLLLPFKYKNYRQTNISLYAEFVGKAYSAGQVFLGQVGSSNTSYEISGSAISVFAANNYMELHPGIQAILRSNLRIDYSVGFPLINRSYTHYYPLFSIAIQRYLY